MSRFFWGAGVPVIEGYGLTETTAPATGQRPGDLRPGTVGTPMPGTTVRISDDGEVLLRGPGVFGGYTDTSDDADAFVDGFFRTGDVGRLGASGRLTLTGRTKNLIVTASGKNVAPEPWEEAVARSPLVAHALMVGERRSHLTALLLLDADAVRAWASEGRQSALSEQLDLAVARASEGRVVPLEDAALRARLDRTIARANAAVSRAEQVRDYRMVVADLTASSPVLTPTLKLRRDALTDAAASEIEALYR